MPDKSFLDYVTLLWSGVCTLMSIDEDDLMKYNILVMQQDPYWFIYDMIYNAMYEAGCYEENIE